MLRAEAEALGCVKELLHIRRIAAEGTSTARQRATYAKAIEAGAGPEEAAKSVVDGLIAEYREG